MVLRRDPPREGREMTMDENAAPRSTKSTPGSANGMPFWAVGAILFGVVLVILVAAFYLNNRLRPPTTIEANSSVATAPSASVPPTPIPTTAPASAAAPAVATSAPTTTAGPTIAVPSGVRVAQSPEEREIEAAYLHYWQVRSAALLNLDTSHLADVMADPELTRDIKQVDDLKAQSKAARVVITQHSIAFLKVAPDQAEIYDEYVNQSYLVDPQSKQPFGTPGPGGVAKVSYQLQKIDGVWKVTDGTRNN